MANLKIKLVRSLAGCKKDHVATALSLKLKRIGDETLQPDNGPTKGKIHKIDYLVEVTNA